MKVHYYILVQFILEHIAIPVFKVLSIAILLKFNICIYSVI